MFYNALKFLVVLVFFCRWQTAAALALPDIGPENFSHSAPIAISDANAVIVRARLPQWVYLASVQGLNDLRVFNADHIAVAHRLSPMFNTTPERAFTVKAVAIPADAGVEETLHGMADIKVDIAGKVDIHLNGRSEKSSRNTAKITQWVVDDPLVADTTIDHVRFEIAEPATPNFAAEVNIEISEDLRTWQTLASNQKILSYGMRLAQLGIAVPATKARYWRIKSSGEALNRIVKIMVSAQPQTETVYETLTVDCQINRARDKLFCPLPAGQLPVTAVLFDFGAQRVAFNAQISTYGQRPDVDKVDKAQPRQLLNALLTNAKPASVSLTGAPIAAVVLSAQQGGKLAMQNPPRAIVRWPAQQLEFMVDGSSPFVLAAGSATLDINAEQTIDSSAAASSAIIGDPQLKSPQALSKSPEKPRPWLLWSLLGLGVIGLGWMAAGLLRHK